MRNKNRPVGVTVVAIIAIIGGVLQLIGGLSLLGAVTGFVPGLTNALTAAMPGIAGTELFGAFGIGAGVVSLIMAMLSIAFGVGALYLKSWAWTLGVVLYALSVAAGVVALFTVGMTLGVVVSTIIAAAILAYLFTTTVRTAFGHGDGMSRTSGSSGTGSGRPGSHSGGRPVTH